MARLPAWMPHWQIGAGDGHRTSIQRLIATFGGLAASRSQCTVGPVSVGPTGHGCWMIPSGWRLFLDRLGARCCVPSWSKFTPETFAALFFRRLAAR